MHQQSGTVFALIDGDRGRKNFLYHFKPAFGPRLVELNLREPTIPASSAYVH